MLIAMHMPDHTLAPEVAMGATLATLAASAWAWRRRRGGAPPSNPTAPAMMGVVAALVFAGQMVNFAIPGLGISGHFLGAATAALLLGPWGGAATIGLVLVVQCLVFGDGGLTALGANLWNMAIIGVVSAWGVRRMIRGHEGTLAGRLAIAAVAGDSSSVTTGCNNTVRSHPRARTAGG